MPPNVLIPQSLDTLNMFAIESVKEMLRKYNKLTLIDMKLFFVFYFRVEVDETITKGLARLYSSLVTYMGKLLFYLCG